MKIVNKIYLIILMLVFSIIAGSQFSFNKNIVYASNISVTNSNSWTLSGSNYSKSLSASGLSAIGSATSTLSVTVTSKGRLTFKYSNASGTPAKVYASLIFSRSAVTPPSVMSKCLGANAHNRSTGVNQYSQSAIR